MENQPRPKTQAAHKPAQACNYNKGGGNSQYRALFFFSILGTGLCWLGLSLRFYRNLDGFFSDAFRDLYNRYTGKGYKNMPMSVVNEETIMDV